MKLSKSELNHSVDENANKLVKILEDKSRIYFNGNDFNSLSKLEQRRLKFTKFKNLRKQPHSQQKSSEKIKPLNKLSLTGYKMDIKSEFEDFMNKTSFPPEIINISCDVQLR